MDRSYALDLASPVSFVATALEAAAPAAVSLAELVRDYHHVSSSDYVRIMAHEDCATEAEAKRWLIRAAVAELGRHVAAEGDEFRLVSDFDEIRVNRRKIHRYVLADPELDQERAIKAAYVAVREGYPITVPVQGPRGKVVERRLTPHPLSMHFPLMPEREFRELFHDARERGLINPIQTIEDAVLDGRHRIGVASVLGIPVQTIAFTGTEEEARHFVISTNLRRRHLTTAQRTQLVRELYLPDAKREAAENKLNGSSRGGKAERVTTVDSKDGDAPPRKRPKGKGKTAVEIAAEKSAGLASARSIAAMAPVDDAPRTRERVLSGEIKTVGKAREEALIEIGSDDPASLPPKLRGTWDTIGRAKYWIEQAIASQRAGAGLGVRQGGRVPVNRDDHVKRVAEIRSLLDEYEAGLDSAS